MTSVETEPSHFVSGSCLLLALSLRCGIKFFLFLSSYSSQSQHHNSSTRGPEIEYLPMIVLFDIWKKLTKSSSKVLISTVSVSSLKLHLESGDYTLSTWDEKRLVGNLASIGFFIGRHFHIRSIRDRNWHTIFDCWSADWIEPYKIKILT